MQAVNMLQAKTSLSRLVEAIEQGQEREIVIARNGRRQAGANGRCSSRKAYWDSQGTVRGAGYH